MMWLTLGQQKSASLTVLDDTCFQEFPGEFIGIDVLMFFKGDFGISTSDLRIMAATVAPGYNESNVTDEIGPFYYTPGSVDFVMEDCFGFVDLDGDGYTPEQDHSYKFIKNLGFIPNEICNDNIDNNGDGITDCDDSMCAYKPICTGGDFDFSASGSDTTSPNVVFTQVETFDDAAFVKYDTSEPSNGSVLFFNVDSSCGNINTTVNDLGIECSEAFCGYDDYKLCLAMDL